MDQYVESVLINANQLMDNDWLIIEFFLILFHYPKHWMRSNNFLQLFDDDQKYNHLKKYEKKISPSRKIESNLFDILSQ
jgi:hypothetical protein